MPEFRTRRLEREALLGELLAACEALAGAGVDAVSVSFGWDNKLPIDEMWKDQAVPVLEAGRVVLESEKRGVTRIGHSDVFVESPGLLLTLCHEGDVHVAGEHPLVRAFVSRWKALGYGPYELATPEPQE